MKKRTYSVELDSGERFTFFADSPELASAHIHSLVRDPGFALSGWRPPKFEGWKLEGEL